MKYSVYWPLNTAVCISLNVDIMTQGKCMKNARNNQANQLWFVGRLHLVQARPINMLEESMVADFDFFVGTTSKPLPGIFGEQL